MVQKNSPEDLALLKNNTFKVIVTDKSKKWICK
jgi:hypothetical protein